MCPLSSAAGAVGLLRGAATSGRVQRVANFRSVTRCLAGSPLVAVYALTSGRHPPPQFTALSCTRRLGRGLVNPQPMRMDTRIIRCSDVCFSAGFVRFTPGSRPSRGRRPTSARDPKQTFMVLDAKPMPSNQLPSTTGSFSAACWCCRRSPLSLSSSATRGSHLDNPG